VTLSELSTTELSRALGSADTSELFTTARRVAAINAAQLEWVKQTECLTRQGSINLSDAQHTYDIEATLTDFAWLSKSGVSIAITTTATGAVRWIEGKDLTVTSV
jgi:hypothetical protein